MDKVIEKKNDKEKKKDIEKKKVTQDKEFLNTGYPHIHPQFKRVINK